MTLSLGQITNGLCLTEIPPTHTQSALCLSATITSQGTGKRIQLRGAEQISGVWQPLQMETGGGGDYQRKLERARLHLQSVTSSAER